MPYPKKKYRKGYTMFSITDLADEIALKHYVYYKDRVTHPSFIGHMNLFTLMGGIKNRIFHYAIDQQKEYYANL